MTDWRVEKKDYFHLHTSQEDWGLKDEYKNAAKGRQQTACSRPEPAVDPSGPK